jgi:Flp pilus assembly protein TadG
MKYRRAYVVGGAAAKIAQSIKAFWGDTDGVILPYVTIMLVVIVGVSVLALDGSRHMSLQTQLQNGADALAVPVGNQTRTYR